MRDAITPIILCGGGGTRLWPASRPSRPKPFLPLLGDRTLFEEAVGRVADRRRFADPVIVAGRGHVALIEEQLGGQEATIVVEPEGKNTAAAIALAARRLPPDAVMLVCPSDHHIADEAAFAVAADAAAALARQGYLVAFGIRPAAPETGFGYIRRGEALGEAGYRVDRFVEKPDRARAEAFLADGGYDWNGGIFVFRAGDFLAELEAYRPHLAAHVIQAVDKGESDGARFHPDAAAFARIEGESVDYAVMENTDRAAVVPVSMGWSDIGNWDALRGARACDDDGNCAIGPADLVDCRNVLVQSDSLRVSAVGLEDVMIVVNGDEVLVTSAAGAQKVGTLPGAKGR